MQAVKENSVWSATNYFYVAVMYHIYKASFNSVHVMSLIKSQKLNLIHCTIKKIARTSSSNDYGEPTLHIAEI